jgi:hypothetical protein
MNRITVLCLLLGFLATSPVWAADKPLFATPGNSGPGEEDGPPPTREVRGEALSPPSEDKIVITGQAVSVACDFLIIDMTRQGIHRLSCRIDGQLVLLGSLSVGPGQIIENFGKSNDLPRPGDKQFVVEAKQAGNGTSLLYGKEASLRVVPEQKISDAKPSKKSKKNPKR